LYSLPYKYDEEFKTQLESISKYLQSKGVIENIYNRIQKNQRHLRKVKRTIPYKIKSRKNFAFNKKCLKDSHCQNLFKKRFGEYRMSLMHMFVLNDEIKKIRKLVNFLNFSKSVNIKDLLNIQDING
jgi:hypothetical protein